MAGLSRSSYIATEAVEKIQFNAVNYTDLLTKVGMVSGDLSYVDSSQGTKWLPGTIGGSYYPEGWYRYNGTSWVSDRNDISEKLSELDSLGYAVYMDGTYVSNATALSTTVGNTSIIDIDGATTIKTQLPVGVTDFFDVATSKILPVNANDGFSYTISFNAQNSVTEGAFSIFLDIGGGFTQIFARTVTFPRGSNTEQPFTFTTQGYQGSTFKANGGLIKIYSDRGTTRIYNIRLQIHKTHNAR